jgi:uncharacterized protein
MVGKVIYISDSLASIRIDAGTPEALNLINLHIMFEDNDRQILGEVEDISEDVIKVHFLGEIINGKFVGGIIRKPTLKANVRLITKDEIGMIVGEDKADSFILGTSPLYDDYPIRVDVNDLFSNHLAVFGNSGSGKSWGVARLLQNVFGIPQYLPYKANFFIFDTFGEYHNAFRDINKLNPNYNFKFFTTEEDASHKDRVCIPLWLLNVEDIALLLSATEHTQLTIIERMIKLVSIFSQNDDMAIKYKNHLIAKAIMSILYTNQTSSAKRNDIFAIVAATQTPQFNLEAPVQGIGYIRRFRECFLIDNEGHFTESVLVTKYITGFIDDDLEYYEPKDVNFFSLEDLEKALAFTLISEGLLRNEKAYNSAIALKVRLHAIVVGKYAPFFDCKHYVSRENYISSLVSLNGKKAQIVNFNLEDVDDWFGKFVTKFYSRILFDFTKGLNDRASIPFHIFLEEAHRFVQNDMDKELFGYNIFERVAKEGRKYGLILNLISQRPVDISETVISQISNFMIFKMSHPRDLEYIKKMLPNISAEVVEKQKTLQPGTCVAFGRAFKVPMIVKMQKPDPTPSSSNSDVYNKWRINQ